MAPGPIWTPLIPASFDAKKVSQHGAKVPMKRMGHPVELAGAYVLLASNEGSYNFWNHTACEWRNHY